MRPTRPRRPLALVVLALSVLASTGTLSASAHAASTTPVAAAIRGEAVSWTTDAPVGGATILLPDYGARATTGPDGRFVFPGTFPTDHPYRRIDVVVTAEGFGRLTLEDVPLVAGETLQLHAELRDHAFVHRVQLASDAGPAGAQQHRTEAPTGFTCTGWIYHRVPPPSIWVNITDEGVSKQYDFTFYVTHVLPSEWIPSWDADSLGAGAIATKSYGWFKTMPNNARSSGPGCADINDDWSDQVFDPSWSYPTTDQAIYATFGSVLQRDGLIFPTQYWAGYGTNDPCAPVQGQFAGRMSQWGTQNCALAGKVWPDIPPVFYADTTWLYLQNFLFNPTAYSNAMYPWVGGSGTQVKRIGGGGGYDDTAWILVTPPGAGGNASVYQTRPFDGGTATKYQAALALKCPTANPSGCTVSVRVVVYNDSGQSVTRGKLIQIPNDGAWRFVTFGPAPHGVVHSTVRLQVVSSQQIGVDATVLKAPFGGP